MDKLIQGRTGAPSASAQDGEEGNSAVVVLETAMTETIEGITGPASGTTEAELSTPQPVVSGSNENQAANGEQAGSSSGMKGHYALTQYGINPIPILKRTPVVIVHRLEDTLEAPGITVPLNMDSRATSEPNPPKVSKRQAKAAAERNRNTKKPKHNVTAVSILPIFDVEADSNMAANPEESQLALLASAGMDPSLMQYFEMLEQRMEERMESMATEIEQLRMIYSGNTQKNWIKVEPQDGDDSVEIVEILSGSSLLNFENTEETPEFEAAGTVDHETTEIADPIGISNASATMNWVKERPPQHDNDCVEIVEIQRGFSFETPGCTEQSVTIVDTEASEIVDPRMSSDDGTEYSEIPEHELEIPEINPGTLNVEMTKYFEMPELASEVPQFEAVVPNEVIADIETASAQISSNAVSVIVYADLTEPLTPDSEDPELDPSESASSNTTSAETVDSETTEVMEFVNFEGNPSSEIQYDATSDADVACLANIIAGEPEAEIPDSMLDTSNTELVPFNDIQQSGAEPQMPLTLDQIAAELDAMNASQESGQIGQPGYHASGPCTMLSSAEMASLNGSYQNLDRAAETIRFIYTQGCNGMFYAWLELKGRVHNLLNEMLLLAMPTDKAQVKVEPPSVYEVEIEPEQAMDNADEAGDDQSDTGLESQQ